MDLVSLANNHALDFGVDALLDTFTYLEQAGVRWVGAGRNAAEAYAPAVLDTPAGPVAFVGLTRILHTLAWAAGPDRPGLASAYDEAAAVAAVQAAAELADLVVVLIHWGVERADCPDAHQRNLARLLTEAGADVVAGHHPHVLQASRPAPTARWSPTAWATSSGTTRRRRPPPRGCSRSPFRATRGRCTPR